MPESRRRQRDVERACRLAYRRHDAGPDLETRQSGNAAFGPHDPRLPLAQQRHQDLARPGRARTYARVSIKGYLDTLPGFRRHDAYDENGKLSSRPGGDTPQYDTTTASQQHGYLAMQFTRSLQSLGDDYGYIFDTQAADVDMVDVVLNRRISSF
jgi:hypothetical protein